MTGLQIAFWLYSAPLNAIIKIFCMMAENGSQQKESVTGTINRLDTDYLVLITDDGEYQVMDFGESFSVEGFSEGDDVVITYTGTLGNEEKPPVITAMEAAQ